MQADFWHQKWERGEIGFHQSEVNPLLLAHLDTLKLWASARIFVPLCGKTLDIGWLLEQGYRVAGAELSLKAVDELFEQLSLKPEISQNGLLRHYRTEQLEIFGGDIFELSADALGSVDAIYDRAALVALPAETRILYASQLMDLSRRAPQLLVTYEYDQQLMEGPPFSVSPVEVKQLYGAAYGCEILEQSVVEGGLKQITATESVWLLTQGS